MTIGVRDLKVYWRELVVILLFALPFLVSFCLGLLWLWENAYLLHFGALTLAATAGVVALRSFWKPPPHGVTLASSPGAGEKERRARDALNLIIDGATAADVASIESARTLAVRSIDAVAGAFHPNDQTAWLNVTVPELLMMAEDVSRQVRVAINRDAPIAKSVKISLVVKVQALAAQAKGLWQIYRVLRFVNPANAMVQEAKGLSLDKLTDFLAAAAKEKLAAVIVREVGGAAIKLYAGGYKGDEAKPSAIASKPVTPPPLGPLTVLIVGQGNAGKSSVLNALAGEIRVTAGLALPTVPFFTVPHEHPEIGGLVLVDSPGFGAELSNDWLRKVRGADIILWVAKANVADRAIDQMALRAVRELIRTKQGCETPIVLAATHADRLTPPMEWSPPYDPVLGERLKERNMRESLGALSKSLDIPSDRCAIVKVGTPGDDAWNLDALWDRIRTVLPEAKRRQLERASRGGGPFTLIVDAGKTLKGAVGKAADELKL